MEKRLPWDGGAWTPPVTVKRDPVATWANEPSVLLHTAKRVPWISGTHAAPPLLLPAPLEPPLPAPPDEVLPVLLLDPETTPLLVEDPPVLPPPVLVTPTELPLTAPLPEAPLEPPLATTLELPPEPAVELPAEVPLEPPLATTLEVPPEPAVELPAEAPLEPPLATTPELPPEPAVELPPEAPLVPLEVPRLLLDGPIRDIDPEELDELLLDSSSPSVPRPGQPPRIAKPSSNGTVVRCHVIVHPIHGGQAGGGVWTMS